MYSLEHLMSRFNLQIAIALVLAACGSTGSNGPCHLVRNGQFRDAALPGQTYLVTRSESEQTEEVVEMGHRSRSTVLWIDSCTYKLYARELISGDVEPISSNDTLTVSILSVDSLGFDYRAVISSNNPNLNGLAVNGRQTFVR